MKTKKVHISSGFPASADEIWSKLTKLKTLQYIAAPYAYFRSIDTKSELIWREGMTAQFRLKILGFIPMGIHTIKIVEFNKDNYLVRSIEGNKHVPVWRHTIILEPSTDQTTYYEDVVEIEAGWKTGIVSIWSRVFYRNRQRKWHKLLRLCSQPSRKYN